MHLWETLALVPITSRDGHYVEEESKHDEACQEAAMLPVLFSQRQPAQKEIAWQRQRAMPAWSITTPVTILGKPGAVGKVMDGTTTGSLLQ